MLAKIALHNRTDAELTIEEISKVAQDIFGDDCKSYTAESMLMNARIQLDSYKGRKRLRRENPSNPRKLTPGEKLLCKRHCWNRMHADKDCYSRKETSKVPTPENKPFGTKNRPNTATGKESTCRFCNQNWQPGHQCKEYVEQKRNKTVLSVKVQNDEASKNDKESTRDTEPQTEVENGIRDCYIW